MKKILVLLLALVMMFSIVACKKDDQPDPGTDEKPQDEKVTYTVRAIDEEGNAVDGVVVTFTPKGGTPIPMPTKDGVITYKTAKELTATITAVPSGYEYDKLDVAQSFDENAMLTVVI